MDPALSNMLGCLIGLTACASPVSAPGPVTVAAPAAFLVQSRCADGALAVAEPGCAGAAAQQAGDSVTQRRRDLPAPAGFQTVDGFISADGGAYVTAMSFAAARAPEPFNVARGDGGEVYVVDGHAVRIAATQDGGSPGVMQTFVGAACGGTGWILFRDDAPTGRWAELTASLSDVPAGSACRLRSHAFTRYRLENVALRWWIDGRQTAITLPTIISEHFNAATIDRSTALERTLMVRGVGRAVWEAWTTGPSHGADLAARCPPTAWSTPPAPGWRLNDCRYSTNVVRATGAFSGAAYGWPGTAAWP